VYLINVKTLSALSSVTFEYRDIVELPAIISKTIQQVITMDGVRSEVPQAIRKMLLSPEQSRQSATSSQTVQTVPAPKPSVPTLPPLQTHPELAVVDKTKTSAAQKKSTFEKFVPWKHKRLYAGLWGGIGQQYPFAIFSDDDDIKGNFNFGAQFDLQITRNFALRTGASSETFFWHESTERYVNDGYYGYYEKDKETHSAEYFVFSLTPALTFRPGIFNFTLYAGPYLGGISEGGFIFGGDAGVKIGPGVVFTDMHLGFDVTTFDFFFNNGIGYRYGFVDNTSVKTDVHQNDDGTKTTIVLRDDSWKNKWFSAGAWAGGGFGFNFGAFFDFQWFKYFAIRAGISSEYVDWTVCTETVC